VMDFALSAILRLLHPFMPHMTEELWSLLGLGKGSIQFAAPAQKISLNQINDLASKHNLVSAIYGITQAGRNLRATGKLPSNKKIRFILRSDDEVISGETPTLARLLNAEEVALEPKFQAPVGTPVAVTPVGDLFLPIAAGDQARERERLEREIAKVESEIRTVEAKLQNDEFVQRAPSAVVEDHRRRLNDLNAQLVKLKQAREGLSQK
jgi:valyl-tRNA synthetase